jgi:hypothetical protein
LILVTRAAAFAGILTKLFFAANEIIFWSWRSRTQSEGLAFGVIADGTIDSMELPSQWRFTIARNQAAFVTGFARAAIQCASNAD